jgi:hypothetical protein
MKKITVLLLVFFFSTLAQALPFPKCFNGRSEILPMNEKVIQFKKSLPNLQKVQVFVKATFVRELPPTLNQYGSHQHFIVSLTDDLSNPEGLIEISHSMNGYTFPEASDLRTGPIYICGEYSTTDKNGFPKITKFTPSETGAMIHWTHQSGSSTNYQIPAHGHPNGFIYANGTIFGLYSNL